MTAWEEGGAKLAEAGLLGADPPVREARWIALAALFGGSFTRAQYEAWTGGGRWAGSRLAERIRDSKLGLERAGGDGAGRHIHLTSKRLYRILGMGDSRFRRQGEAAKLLQRLLCVDYVLEHPAAGWVAGGRAGDLFVGRGAEEAILPRRTYAAGKGQSRVVAFPARWPVAFEGSRAMFLFPDPGPNACARGVSALRTWGKQHGALWAWLDGEGVEVAAVFVTRDVQRDLGVRDELRGWMRRGIRYGDDAADSAGDPREREIRAEIGAVEEAMDRTREDPSACQRWGGDTAALRRWEALTADLEALRDSSPRGSARVVVPAPGTWVSRRLEGWGAAGAGREIDVESELAVEPVWGRGRGQ